jgi:RND family efflux transporter MFP subunit
MKSRLGLLLTLAIIVPVALYAFSLASSADPQATPGTPDALSANLGSGVEAIASAQYDKKLAFSIAGRVGSVKVKPGQPVKAGELLMELEDEEGKALISQYEVKVASDVELRIARENLNLAALEERHLRDLVAKTAASPIELDRAVIKKNLAILDVDKAAQEHVELTKQLEQAKAKHAQYCLVAPVTGLVEEVNYYENQSVEPAKPVLRLVVTDPLWIDAPVPTAATLGLKVGDPATVHPTLSGYGDTLTGKVIFIAAVADNARRVIRIELPNPKAMPAGTLVTVDIPPAPAAGAPVAAARRASPLQE